MPLIDQARASLIASVYHGSVRKHPNILSAEITQLTYHRILLPCRAPQICHELFDSDSFFSYTKTYMSVIIKAMLVGQMLIS